MKNGETYFKTSDQQKYKVIGTESIVPIGLIKPQRSHVLQCETGDRAIVRVLETINMNTTREWANTRKMALSNKIKLLENEIVSLNVKKDGLI